MMESKDIFEKSLQRANKIKKDKKRKKQKITAVSVSLFSFFIVLISASAMPIFVGIIDKKMLTSNQSTGTIFANSSLLGYIFIGALAFLLGIVVTLICFKMKDDNEKEDK